MALPKLIDVEDLFADPVRAGATISPDGRRIAFLAPEQDRLNVWVQPVDSDSDDDEAEAVCVTHDHNRGVHRYYWTDDPRWLLYMQDGGGDEKWHLYRVDLDDPTADAVDLTPFEGATVAAVELAAGLAGTAFITINARSEVFFDACAVDIATGEMTTLAENPGDVAGWTRSRTGEIFAYKMPPSGDGDVYIHDAATGELRHVVTLDGSASPVGISPMQPTADGTGLLVGSTRDSDLAQLVRVDIATGEHTLIDSHPTMELDSSGVVAGGPSALILSERTGELIGVRYGGERQVIHALDAHFGDVLGKLAALSDGEVAGLSSDEAERRWVVSFRHDRDPGVTWLYDHDTGEARQLFCPYPQLDPATLAPMTPVVIKSRDGLNLHSYLTLPLGVDPVNLPLVIDVHGGPWYRDSWGFDPTVQLLANRGYAVLQINFRGSSGFGKTFIRAAIHELAGKMHDDLLDGVQWAIDEGIADPSRVAIFGGSYGGYAALVGATFTPDVFAAAIDYCGISSLPNFMRTVPVYARPFLANNWHLYGGDPDIPEQEADLLARSPITKVDQIKIPLLVIQGTNDPRVVQEESDNIVAALRERGVPVDYMVKDNEGHGFANQENVIDMHRALERFLGQHLGGRTANP